MSTPRRASRRLTAFALGLAFAVTACGSPPAPPPLATPTTNAATASPSTVAPNPTTIPPTPSAQPTAAPTVTVTPRPPTVTPSPNCEQGPNQKQVETALFAIGTYGPIVVDGKQTLADCATIKRFQRRMGISPALGRAGPTTGDVATRIAATKVTDCNAATATMACVDLTHQTFYLMKGGKVVLGPTVTRTGMRGYATPAGTFAIFDRALKHWSRPYKVWLPYWQNFYWGDGLHETTTYIHNKGIGSHGCVNLLPADAQKAYSLLTIGSKVRLYGRRPGT